MALSCGAKCAKLLLVIFNAIFWASGVIIFSIGLFFLVEDERTLLFKLFADESTSYALIQYLAWAFVALGSAIFIIGLCGCCGALKESKWLLIMYFIFLLITFAAELTVGILGVVFQEKVVAGLKLELTDKIKKEYGLTSALTAAVDLAQSRVSSNCSTRSVTNVLNQFECCGIDGPDDYSFSVWKLQNLGGPDSNVSKTCCLLMNMKEEQAYVNPRPINNELCQSNDIKYNLLYRHQHGCLAKLEHFIRNESLVFIILGCGLAGISVFGIVISLCLCRAVTLDETDEETRQPSQ
ncbi:Antigen -like protein [Halotydeus destructor]|nr:Antigen -like protein [Halotydeus destructor]